MQNMRKSLLNFSVRHDILPPREFHRSATKKINFGKTYIQRHSLIRHTSTFINKLQKRKTKLIDPKGRENEKTNRDIPNKNIQRKVTCGYNNYNFNKILKNIVIKKGQQRAKINSFYKKKVGTRHFYFIRKQVNQRLKNKYKSPYMLHLIEKGYYDLFKKSDYPKYYNFYMINYLIQNKRCKLTLRYYDNLSFYNHQEYLIRFFNRNEIFIIMNYILHFIYNKDIHSIIKTTTKKKIISDEEIENMFNNLIKSNYNFFGTMEVFEDIAVYYRNAVMNNSNLSHMFFNLDNVRPIFGEEIHYLYAKDVPVLQFPNSYPNFFPLEGVMLNYIKKFIKLRKFEKLKYKIVNIKKNKSDKGKTVKFYQDENNENRRKRNDNNILMNLSLSMSKDKNINDEKSESEENKYLHNSNRRLKVDNDIYDVENLIDKILYKYYGYTIKNKNSNNIKKNISKKIGTIFIKKERVYQRRMQRFKTTQITNILDNQKKNFISPKTLKLKNNIESLIDIKPKAGIFKTSLKRLNELQNTKEYNSEKRLIHIKDNKGSNKNIVSFREGIRPKSSNNVKLILFKKRKEKENNDFPSPHTELNILKFSHKNFGINHNEIKKEDSEKNIIKNKNNNNNPINNLNFKEFINKENKFKYNSEFRQIFPSKNNLRNSKRNNSSARTIFNFNDKNISIRTPIREVSSNNSSSSQNIFFFKFKDTSKFISNSTKNRYNVNKFISLKKINSISRNKLNTQIKKIKNNSYKGLSQKAFSTSSGINFDEKVVNEWESANKIEGVTVMDAYKTNNLFTKIKNFNNKNQNDFKKSSTFNEIIKCPNIYISNLG